MKIWILAGIFSAMTIPFAAAAETSADCQLDDARRGTQRQAAQPQASPSTPRQALADRAAEPARPDAPRRRSGKHIPDAELIGVRGAL